MWTVFDNLKHNISPAINGEAFTSAYPVHEASTTPSGSKVRRPGGLPIHDKILFRLIMACGPLMIDIML